MSTSSLDGLIAGRVTLEREARGWSLGELAARSGVSRAMISKIERGDARPTASLLGKLSAAFSLPLSLLFARVEQSSSRVSRAGARTRWRDPASGHTRLAISPPSDAVLQLTEVSLPPRAKVSFPAAAYTFIHQQRRQEFLLDREHTAASDALRPESRNRRPLRPACAARGQAASRFTRVGSRR